MLDEPAAVGGADLPTTMPGVFRAREVVTAHGTFGHLRIFTFSVAGPGRVPRRVRPAGRGCCRRTG